MRRKYCCDKNVFNLINKQLFSTTNDKDFNTDYYCSDFRNESNGLFVLGRFCTKHSQTKQSNTKQSKEKYGNERKNRPIQNSPKTVPSNNCFNQPVSREFSFAQQT